ncbi:acetyl-CoA C-acetyltransferase [Pseudomonas synxantha]|uniref:Acetyl-CoA C-acetyltransferase n=1 Tax=Pseudomonas synxantha TaxID=47883 RepID=A0ABS0UPR9_9PSED|nr:acetyl-CoA C-acetyltransferase [Pseudomonas synxantha]MBI6567599.1 acetyl-CoA C-acetyltransferase [Pseudomonas synxantha]MBI6582286.1 acetyl-CoA C-acetyltransferase [Pseudomonas synxantha]MBI6645471.1 acetyl-CoA C-acetyltransferase [Pseudomonas synxantha]
MKDALIVSPLRTPIGKFGGALASLTADHLAATIMRSVLDRTDIDPASLDEVVVAQSYASSEAPCMGRYAALLADLPLQVPGYSLDRRCGSGLQAVINAAMQVQTGHAEAVMVVGVESMSNIEYYSTDMRWGSRAGSVKLHDRLERGRERSQPESRFGRISGMPETAENLARDYAITREDADQFAVRSHLNAARAWQEGRFANEVVPLDVPRKRGAIEQVAVDEGIRADASLESLAGLRPLLPNGICTAGNSSQQNDAAAGCLVVSADYASRHGLRPLARLADWAAAGCDPSRMGIGPVPAVARLLQRTGLNLADMDLIEVNEAFAAQALAVLRAWQLEDFERVNVNGSGISLGHPIGATGIRIMTTLLHEMQRRNARYGLETMCIGGGQGLAAIFEHL